MGDSVVPHTPVLQENKQMAAHRGTQALPTPADPPINIVPQLAERSLATATPEASGVVCVYPGTLGPSTDRISEMFDLRIAY